MFKYGKFYSSPRPFAEWLEEFGKECHGYTRTFNICDWAKDITQLKDTMVTAYQPLQSLPDLTDDEIEKLCAPTVEAIKVMHTDVDAFLKYQGVDDDKAEMQNSFLPPYYRALYYNHALANDTYVKDKMKKSLKRAIEASYTGKLLVDGNYTIVGSDPLALLEWAFAGGDKSKVKGLLDKDEIYSNYWNLKGEQKPRFHMYLPKNVNLRKEEKQAIRMAKEEAKKAGQDEFRYESKFSDVECTMNRVCSYMKEQFDGKLSVNYGEGEFTYLSLMKSTDKNLKYRDIYEKVRERFLGQYNTQLSISDDCRESVELKLSDTYIVKIKKI